ncbi:MULTISPECIES: cobalt ABC transporter substrate-binding protein [Rhodopseudomonas]|uniref:Cobalt ABC transporter substrate-binding protein n=1 Tax=Rhodopseudomonas palustris TaxID=1076 RepID=A0A0D7EE52_RHOPL|nr:MULTISPECIES: cobalt ABC transporter substrate-binding protein [Rhodopseudomonas]KIZ39119.1 cobalt ABC transporter substrate-binding protein [Rhodopseudomonas palustris]MDF3808986.1 cobalt ABC transporter substrate-binding protein [Rhodopseudomonas sp. BAL398]WOK20017.1 cobalt ABC transporter substrate-binding protein [Rhodopseudomonas sp. BAL398]
MKKLSLALIALFGVATSAQAHQIWIEQADGQSAVVRFGEFGENLREASPGLLDKFGKPTATLIAAKGEQSADAAKTATGFTLPFAAKAGDSIVAEDANYPLYTWKQQDKEVRNWFHPAARLITDFSAQQPKLTLDLVPTGKAGQFKLVFKDQPKPKTKVALTTQSGWTKEAHTDEQGLVSFEMPWKGLYVAEVSVNDRTAGERAGEKYDAVSYATTVTYVKPDGLPPIPPGPAATPGR